MTPDIQTKKIFLGGLTSSSLGGMEYANLGNYIIIEPLVEKLHEHFPNAQIVSSIQMSDEFCTRFKFVSLRHKRFWSYGLDTALHTLGDIVLISIWSFFHYLFQKDIPSLLQKSILLKELSSADVIIDFSGDRYGDNANPRQFLEKTVELWFAKILQKPVAMLMGSPGPFHSFWRQMLAKITLRRLPLVTNREPLSTEYLHYIGITGTHIHSTACPSVFFKKAPDQEMLAIIEKEHLNKRDTRPVVGLIICGWNMPSAPYTKWPREDWEYQPFINLIDHIITQLRARVCVMSHQNGVDKQLQLTKGNDHKIIDRLLALTNNTYTKEDLFTLQGCYTAAQSKAIIAHFDMVISGRIHGAVQALSQGIPTAIIDYGHEPKAHKLKGFAKVYGVEDYVLNPTDSSAMNHGADRLFNEKEQIKHRLQETIPQVKQRAEENFELLKHIIRPQ